MNSDLEQLNSQSSVFSVDSSLLCSMTTKTVTLKHTASPSRSITQTISIQINEQKDEVELFQEEKQLCRINNSDNCMQPFIGFMGGFNNKPIMISKRKLKKAQIFMNDGSFSEEDRQQIKQIQEAKKQFSQMQQFVPLFTTGANKEVKITKEMFQKVNHFFSDFDQFKKQTKKIKNNQQNSKEDHPKDISTIPANKIRKRFSQPNQQFNIKIPTINNRFTNTQSINFIWITLKDLKKIKYPIKQLNNRQIPCQFQHSAKCNIVCCLFCQWKWKSNINKSDIIEMVVKKCKSQIPQSLCEMYYDTICFKLLKYQCLFPQIMNKRLNPNNIALQLFKKLDKYSQGFKGYLSECVSYPRGQSLKLMIRQIIYSKQLKGYYIKLTDGWTYVWAVIQSQNALYKYINKMSVGMKIEISGWVIHSITNIISFLPFNKNNKEDVACIEFYLNGSRIIEGNQKLGRSKYHFYKSLEKCKKDGGIIPLIKGIVIRMFSPNNKTQKRKIKENSSASHYIQLLTYEQQQYYLEIVLSCQVSLVQLFQLYRSYNFYQIKMVKQSHLLFLKQSKYVERSDENKKPIIEKILKSRFPSNLLIDGNKYDILSKDGKYLYKDNEIFIQSGSSQYVLYQQYIYKQDKKCFIRDIFSSNLRRLPKIYDQINIDIKN